MDQEIKDLTIEDKKEQNDEVDIKEGKKIMELTEVEKQKNVMRRKSDLPQVKIIFLKIKLIDGIQERKQISYWYSEAENSVSLESNNAL